MNYSKVYIVSRSDYESWDIVSIYDSEDKAIETQERLNSSRDKVHLANDVYYGVSTWDVE